MSLEGWVYIHPKVNSSKVLGCAGGSDGNKTAIVIYHVDGTLNQKWHYQLHGGPAPETSYLTFRPLHNENKAFDTNNGDGKTCWLWDYDPNNINQQFQLWEVEVSGGHSWWTFQRMYDQHQVICTGSTENSSLTVVTPYVAGNEYGQFWVQNTTHPTAGKSQTPAEARNNLKAALNILREGQKIRAQLQAKGASGEKAKKAAKKKAPAKAKAKAKAKAPAKAKKATAKKKASGKGGKATSPKATKKSPAKKKPSASNAKKASAKGKK